MRNLILLLILAACSPTFKTKAIRHLATDEQRSRQEKHNEAAEEFKKLHFFAAGRGMMISPGLIDIYNQTNNLSRNILIKQIFGLNMVDGEAIGFFETEYKGNNIGVLGCVACHSGKAAGQYIMGLGNKNIDVYQIGRSTLTASKIWKKLNIKKMNNDDDYRGLTEDAIDFAKTLSNQNYSNLTQGLVPTGVIRTWFYRQAGKPIPEDLPRAAVKVPHMWGYGVKRQVGSFSDGGGNGKLPGWAIAVELVANQKPEVIRTYLHKIEHTENLLGDFLPPKYPFKIERKQADLGKITFDKTCAKCHGTYERDPFGLAIYKEPKWIPHHVVKTDDDRLNNIEGEFLELVRTNPLKDILIDSARDGRGYFAPRLEGVWARFPYLHNGSVPTIMDLLNVASKRPKQFSLKDAGEKSRFDSNRLGLKIPRRRKLIDFNRNLRSWYDTSLEGQSNKGHEFYTDLTLQEKQDLIEYLKTL